MEQVWSGRWALQRGCCLYPLSPSPLPTSFWMATGCLLPLEGSSPMAVLHSAALEGI